jgi:hypothetical protein
MRTTAVIVLGLSVAVTAWAQQKTPEYSINIRADFYGHSRFCIYSLTNGQVAVAEMNVQDKRELSKYTASIQGNAAVDLAREVDGVFRTCHSSEKLNQLVKDGAKYTVDFTVEGKQVRIVNYESPDDNLRELFRVLNQYLPGKYQLHNP